MNPLESAYASNSTPSKTAHRRRQTPSKTAFGLDADPETPIPSRTREPGRHASHGLRGVSLSTRLRWERHRHVVRVVWPFAGAEEGGSGWLQVHLRKCRQSRQEGVASTLLLWLGMSTVDFRLLSRHPAFAKSCTAIVRKTAIDRLATLLGGRLLTWHYGTGDLHALPSLVCGEPYNGRGY